MLSGLSEQLPAQLRRNTLDDSLHLGTTLTGDQAAWHWNVTGNGDVGRNRTSTTDLGQTFAPGNAQSTRVAGEYRCRGQWSALRGAGRGCSVTLRAAASGEYLDIDEQHFATPPTGTTKRSSAIGAASIDIPISHRGRGFGALGNLTLSGNAEVEPAVGLRNPGERSAEPRTGRRSSSLTLIGSWNSEEQAPSVRQLGDPFVETPGTRIFDFSDGVVNRVSVVTGGNPDLRTDRRKTLDLSARWQPFGSIDFRLRGDFAQVTIDRPISNITVFPEIEAAFPDRFVRDGSGNLVAST